VPVTRHGSSRSPPRRSGPAARFSRPTDQTEWQRSARWPSAGQRHASPLP
jgi:hypothetical protein